LVDPAGEEIDIMTNRAAVIQEIKQGLNALSDAELAIIRQKLHRKSSPAAKRVEALEGIWAHLGLDKIDIESDIREFRREVEENLEKKSREWFT
jgi:hypothetical protein